MEGTDARRLIADKAAPLPYGCDIVGTPHRRFAAYALSVVLRTAAYGIGIISAYWFIERTFA